MYNFLTLKNKYVSTSDLEQGLSVEMGVSIDQSVTCCMLTSTVFKKETIAHKMIQNFKNKRYQST